MMKQWKRAATLLLAGLLAGALLAGFTACGKEPKNDTTTTTDSSAFIEGISGREPESTDAPSGDADSPDTPIGSDTPVTPAGPTQTEPQMPESIRVTIYEGDTLAKAIRRLADAGVASYEGLWKAVNGYDYSKYSLIANMPSKTNRCFNIEGYLYPDTYHFSPDSNPEDVLGRLIRNREERFTSSMRSRAAELGYSVDDILTIASLVEKEGKTDSDRKKVASVLYNRLKAGMKLQLDYTINYVENAMLEYLPYAGISNGDRFRAAYNTYKCTALPAGPVCNPGAQSINAALYPEQTNYLFFVSSIQAGSCYFSATYEEHEAKCNELGIQPQQS